MEDWEIVLRFKEDLLAGKIMIQNEGLIELTNNWFYSNNRTTGSCQGQSFNNPENRVENKMITEEDDYDDFDDNEENESQLETVYPEGDDDDDYEDEGDEDEWEEEGYERFSGWAED